MINTELCDLAWKLCTPPYIKIYRRRDLSPVIHVLLRAMRDIALKTLRSALHKDKSQTGFEPGHPCPIMRDIALNYRDGGLGFLAHPIYFWFIT